MKKLEKRFLELEMNKVLSPLLSAYSKTYSTKYVIIRLVEKWKEQLDNKYLVGSVFIDLSKVFDCIPHDLLTSKLDAYGFNRNLARYIYSYLEKRKQCVRCQVFPRHQY